MKVMKGRGTIQLKQWLDKRDGPALGRGDGGGAADAEGPFKLGRLLARRQAGTYFTCVK